MPVRIPVIYPRYQRPYANRAPVGSPFARGYGQGGQVSRGGGRGAVQPGAVDTAPTGNIGGDIVKAINASIQSSRQNAAANQILNTQTPPRAAWAGGTAPAPGISTGGTAPQTGGMGELQMRQQLQQQDLADQLQRAKIASELALARQRSGGGGGGGGAGGGNAARWKEYLGKGGQGGQGGQGKGAKPPPYAIGSDANTNLDADKFPNVQADFDAQFGKNSYAKIAPNLSNATVDEKGNYVITDPNDPAKTLMTLPPDKASYWMARYNAALVRSGQQPIGADKFPSANPNSGQPAGSPTNPYVPKNQLEARSLPYGKENEPNGYFKNPDTGQIGQKLPEDKATSAPPAGQKTSALDSTGSNQVASLAPPAGQPSAQPPAGALDFSGGNNQVAANTPPQTQPTQVANLVPPVGQPAMTRPDMATGVGLDQTAGAAPTDAGSQSLADAITKARLVQQFQGLA